MNKLNLWDKKAKTFPRYKEDLSAIQKESFGIFEALGLDFNGKSLIDVGCGTGVWTLHLAQKAKTVLALDASNAMLEILKEDSLRLNLSNITCKNSDFEGFYTCFKDKFDIAFSSMSPALNKKEDYEAFLNLAPCRIYLGWQEYRQSDFLEPIFKALGARQKCFNDDDIESYLKKEGIKFEKQVFDETRRNEKSKEVALENALWHLNMAGLEPSPQELEKFVKAETIIEVVKSKIKLLIF